MSDIPVAEDEPEPKGLADGRPMGTRRAKRKGDANAPKGSPTRTLDDATITLHPGDRLIAVGNLRLDPHPDATSTAMTRDLARVIESATGCCHLVFTGDFDGSADDHRIDAVPILNAHQRLVDAVAAFGTKPGCSVSICPRARCDADRSLRPGESDVAKRMNARFVRSIELTVESGSGTDLVRIGSDPVGPSEFAARRPCDPTPDSSLDSHPTTPRSHSGQVWLDGNEDLIDPNDSGVFAASRFFYRRIAKWLGWALLPLLTACLTLLIGAGAQLITRNGDVASLIYRITTYLALGGVVLVAGTSGTALVAWRSRTTRSDRIANRARRDPDEPVTINDPSRDWAGQVVEDGHAGYIATSTAQPELTGLGRGFYANSGRCGTVTVRRPGRLGFPDAWASEQQWSWLEVEAASRLRVRLHFRRRPLLTTTFGERVLSKASPISERPDRTVAEWPGGEDWPAPVPRMTSRRNVRRLGAALLAGAGLVNLISAVLPPIHDRIDAVDSVIPLAVSQAAATVVALLGLGLLLVARGVRRGQYHAWLAAMTVLITSVALHVIKGLDLEEALVSAGVAAYLGAQRRHFRVRADDVSIGKGLTILGAGLGVALVTAVASIKLVPHHLHPELSWPRAVQASVERLVGVQRIPIGPHLDGFLTPVLVAVTCGVAISAGWLLFSPVLADRSDLASDDAARARRVVTSADGGTLAYFALRDDKQWFFFGNTVIAYAIIHGIALVSPDPIGPVAERRRAWNAFGAFADRHGWPIMVMGASQEWLPIYRASGLHDLYVGDEAVVDARRFTLEGPRNKAIRQAVNRVRNKGYTIEFHDPLHLDDATEDALRALMSQSRRGDVERGFSMTLGRVFDRRDEGLLLAICRGPDGAPAAFCQYVPAPAIDGFSLDLMRRSEQGEHPNGLTDFVIAETIIHLRDTGRVGLGLNFATMRATLAGERGEGTVRRVERWFYQKMSDTMQIESLWHYNAKFDPDWVPRYACYESVEHVPASAIALATAESWWEIPVIGRLFRPSGDTPSSEVPQTVHGVDPRDSDAAAS